MRREYADQVVEVQLAILASGDDIFVCVVQDTLDFVFFADVASIST